MRGGWSGRAGDVQQINSLGREATAEEQTALPVLRAWPCGKQEVKYLQHNDINIPVYPAVFLIIRKLSYIKLLILIFNA